MNSPPKPTAPGQRAEIRSPHAARAGLLPGTYPLLQVTSASSLWASSLHPLLISLPGGALSWHTLSLPSHGAVPTRMSPLGSSQSPPSISSISSPSKMKDFPYLKITETTQPHLFSSVLFFLSRCGCLLNPTAKASFLPRPGHLCVALISSAAPTTDTPGPASHGYMRCTFSF